MSKKLLCTISEDVNMSHGLRFLSRFFQNKDDMELTLLGMAAPDSPYCLWRAGKEGATQPLEQDRNWQMIREEALSMLQREGFNMDKVRVKSSSNMLCRIEDIEAEIDQDSYDAVVMGRRGQHRLRDFLQKSLSRRFLERSPDAPLILCRRPDVNRRDILLCVDDSPSSLAMAKFVATMVDKESHLVTLCNIVRDTSDDRDNSIKIGSCLAESPLKGYEASYDNEKQVCYSFKNFRGQNPANDEAVCGGFKRLADSRDSKDKPQHCKSLSGRFQGTDCPFL